MKVISVRTPTTPFERDVLDQMHRLRARVFGSRLGWAVTCENGHERDEFDTLRPTYILVISTLGDLVGCVRLLPGLGPTMLQNVFPQLLEQRVLRGHAGMVESSRFCVDTARPIGQRGTIHGATLSLLAGIVEWCLLQGYSELVTATDLRFERLLAKCQWPMQRLGSPYLINETVSVAGRLTISEDVFDQLKPAGYQSSFKRDTCEAA